MANQAKLDSLEGLRFLSSVSIVAAHYIPYAVSTPLIGRLHLAVDLFFVISGVVIAERYADQIASLRDWLGFMIKRIARIYPLHLATLAFYVVIGVLVWSGRVHPADTARYNVGEIIPNLLMIHAWRLQAPISFNYVSWSISAEFFVYLSFPLILLAVRWRAAIGLLSILALFAVFAVIAEHEVGRPLTRLDWRGGVLRAIPSFAFGVWLNCHLPALQLRFETWRLRSLLHGSLLFLLVLVLLRVDEYAILAVVWAVVALAYAADRSSLATWVSVPWLASRGRLTYSLYMLHTVVATVVLAVLAPKLFGTSLPARIGGVILASCLLYGFADVSLRYFESPLRRIIGDWGKCVTAIRPAAVTKRQ